ncbi:MAG TPA: rubredoxin [archaeon]|nr:rubredoxin [archaeon]
MVPVTGSESFAVVFQCRACGYVYRESQGNEFQDIPSGTKFLELPGSWRCPVCAAPKANFAETTEGKTVKHDSPTQVPVSSEPFCCTHPEGQEHKHSHSH